MLDFKKLPKELKTKPSTIFSNGTEYEIFRDNFCATCINHVETEEGFVAMPENGGCIIENGLEDARFDETSWPKEIVEIWEGDKCINWYYCTGYVPALEEREECEDEPVDDIEGQIMWLEYTV